jgi:hypothetical protein
MARKIASFISFVAITANAYSYTGYGIGMKSCGHWVQVRNQGNFYDEAQWVLGYLTAAGYYQSIKLKTIDSAAVLTFMDNYCREKPLEEIEGGAQALVDALVQKN